TGRLRITFLTCWRSSSLTTLMAPAWFRTWSIWIQTRCGWVFGSRWCGTASVKRWFRVSGLAQIRGVLSYERDVEPPSDRGRRGDALLRAREVFAAVADGSGD